MNYFILRGSIKIIENWMEQIFITMRLIKDGLLEQLIFYDNFNDIKINRWSESFKNFLFSL
jgi:hypothetical protein